MVSDRWPDDRLDEMNRRLINVEGMSTTVAVVKTRLDGLEDNVSKANQGIERLSDKLNAVVDEPMVRGRDFRRQVLQGALAAGFGGSVVFIASLIAGQVH